MNYSDAHAIAAYLYPGHLEAAAALIVQATSPEPSEDRERAAAALRCLAPDDAFYSGPVRVFAEAIADHVCGAIYSAEYEDRQRLASLVDAILIETDALRRRNREHVA